MSHQVPKNKSSTETTVDGKALYLVTAGGKIKCLHVTVINNEASCLPVPRATSPRAGASNQPDQSACLFQRRKIGKLLTKLSASLTG